MFRGVKMMMAFWADLIKRDLYCCGGGDALMHIQFNSR
jgi:hypothetical protein